MKKSKNITSIEQLIKEVKLDFKKWGSDSTAWFRGEMNKTDYPLLPKLYRPINGKVSHNENRLLQNFRNKAPSFSQTSTPQKGNTDEWLFLAQHAGLPTRLLDWTEGLLYALHFALQYEDPVVWMLDPLELNRRTVPTDTPDFPLTWFSPENTPATARQFLDAIGIITANVDGIIKHNDKFPQFSTPIQHNIGNVNIRAAWEKDNNLGTDLPVAIYPTYIHERMNAQRSCFTIQGRKKVSLANLVDERVLKKYIISPRAVTSMRNDLRTIGITHTSVFPDIDNLAKDLADIF